ncbi:helix-turn-helix transcriptional regulator [Lactococcus garvieae]|uniref:helix-turn-helix domain-containing protein n=1 Tax=Lactococcus garvieae TaxID=1363 RepID=UPI001F612CAC|nr:helix-turn-helix transcriptional regulator [Lactococcus garvieae]MCI3860111.1 helix-turn-helix domain-containing protein [Lactococcus garvieae]
MNIFSERLKTALREKNIKAIELSQKTGISKSSISDWINGRYEAKQDKIFLIAEALNINEGYLLGLDVPMHKEEFSSNNSTLSKINKISEQLDEPRQQVVLEAASSQLKEQKEEEKKNANVIPLKKKKVTDEELWEIVEHGVANDGSEQTDTEKQFFFNLLREHLDNDDEYED